MKTPVFAAALALAASLAATGAAVAQDYHIAFGDLDLSTPQGADALDRRVNRAVRSYCVRPGSRLQDVRCASDFRAEVQRLLPVTAREEYARARGGRILALVPMVYG